MNIPTKEQSFKRAAILTIMYFVFMVISMFLVTNLAIPPVVFGAMIVGIWTGRSMSITNSGWGEK